jgi:hypothetical protein
MQESVLQPAGVATDPKMVETEHGWPTPTSVNEVRAFFGFAGHYRKFVKNFSLTV